MKLFGVPYGLLGILCAAVATLYFFVTPKAMFPNAGIAFVLRYFHPLTWLLLCAACLTVVFTQDTSLAKPFALAALVVYAMFMLCFVLSKTI